MARKMATAGVYMDKWETLGETEVTKGKIFTYLKKKAKSPDSGKIGDFDVLNFADWVNVVAITDDQEIILVRQYRVGNDLVTLEIPGGAVDLGEDDHKLALIRELQEETGYRADCVTELGPLFPNPAFMSNIITTYLATGCKKVSAQNLDHLEEIEVVTYPISEIKGLIKSGEIKHSLIVAALYLFELHS
ncbi:MAG: NUDIX hydrolase [Bacteriovoracaceae bacterium]|nr:NUDIX hydrolase [Bacteriovoracaceae bacterium]